MFLCCLQVTDIDFYRLTGDTELIINDTCINREESQICVLLESCNRDYLRRVFYGNKSKSNSRAWTSLLLICCGDISINPGPYAVEYTNKFKPHIRSLIYKLIKTQEKYIESSLHGYFLSKYEDENVTPPGLILSKTPQITNAQEISATWNSILKETSMKLNKSLIDIHNKNTIELASLYEEQRQNLLEKLNESEKIEMTSWLQQRAINYRNNISNRKEKKFLRNIKTEQKKSKSKTTIKDEEKTDLAFTKSSLKMTTIERVNVNEEETIIPPGRGRKRKNRRSHRNHVLKSITDAEADTDIIVNLSDYELTDAEKRLLKKGLKFVPTPSNINRTELFKDVHNYGRRVRLKEFFFDDNQETERPSPNKYKTSSFTPKHGRDQSLDSYIITVKETFRNMKGRKVSSNLTPEEEEAIESLRRNKSIVIFPADKGGAIVIQNRENYIKTATEHLESLDSKGKRVYDEIRSDITKDIAIQVNHVIDEAKLQSVVDEDTAEGLKVVNPNAGNIYMLPKIHKDPKSRNPPPRPICNSKNTPTEKISQWVDEQLQPLVKELPSYLQDDSDFLRKINELNQQEKLPPGTLLVTLDIKSLYTNIPTEGGEAACRYFLEKSHKKLCVVSTIMKFISLILKFNFFKFGNNFFIQRSGTAMGTKMAPSYANLFMGYLEKDLLMNCLHKPLVWYRYIDDIFLIWTHGQEKLDDFLKLVNENKYGMVFEAGSDSISTISVPFLDVNVVLRDGRLITDLYVKPTDKFQYLDFKSCHPYHQKANLPHGLALRIRRICSETSDFKHHCENLVSRLRSRGFKMGLIKDAIRKASSITREEALKPTEQTEKEDRVIFSLTYNPRLPNINEKLSDLQPVLHASERCKKIFPHPPIVAYRRNRSLNDLLVSRRLPPTTEIANTGSITTIDTNSNICEICGRSFCNGKGKLIHMTRKHNRVDTEERKPGFSKCKDSRCHTCNSGYFGDRIKISATNQLFTIKQSMTCKSNNVIYCVTCKKCSDQYIGETSQELHDRSVGHLSDIRCHKEGLPYVTHFNQCGIEHYSITAIEKVRSNDPLIRKQRESYYKNLFQVKIK